MSLVRENHRPNCTNSRTSAFRAPEALKCIVNAVSCHDAVAKNDCHYTDRIVGCDVHFVLGYVPSEKVNGGTANQIIVCL